MAGWPERSGADVAAPQSLLWALAQHRPGHALPRLFAIDQDIYAHEEASIWRQSWLFAGCSADAPDAGSFFRVDLGDDSVLVVRDDDGTLHALHNTSASRDADLCRAIRCRETMAVPIPPMGISTGRPTRQLRRDGESARSL
jgi:Rieske 2Fe-2S family protein